ncbi:MAG TPA: hypothetical protein VF913_12415 [Xanthobacteraceae bacterium]
MKPIVAIPAPNLQDLVAKHGGHDKVTSEAWAEWDRINKDYQQHRRDALREEQARHRSKHRKRP